MFSNFVQKTSPIQNVFDTFEKQHEYEHGDETNKTSCLVCSALNSSNGVLSSPCWFIQPHIKNIQTMRFLQVSIPWLTGAAADPNPFYCVCSSLLGRKALDSGYLNGGISSLVCVVLNHGRIGERLLFENTGANGNGEEWGFIHMDSKDPISSIDFYIVDPTGARVTMTADWSVTLLIRSSTQK